ncbi:Nucleoside diphosphate kinase [Bienertia sinuspersici]
MECCYLRIANPLTHIIELEIQTWTEPPPKKPEVMVSMKIPVNLQVVIYQIANAFVSYYSNNFDLMNRQPNATLNLSPISCMTRAGWERSSSCYEMTRYSIRFNDWIEEMELIEVEFDGAIHTWARGNTSATQRSAQLDRALCNSEWSLGFNMDKVKQLLMLHSDHFPLLISRNGFAPLDNADRPFKFQAVWLTHEQFQEFLVHKWNSYFQELVSLLQSLASNLMNWNKEVFGNTFKRKEFVSSY